MMFLLRRPDLSATNRIVSGWSASGHTSVSLPGIDLIRRPSATTSQQQCEQVHGLFSTVSSSLSRMAKQTEMHFQKLSSSLSVRMAGAAQRAAPERTQVLRHNLLAWINPPSGLDNTHASTQSGNASGEQLPDGVQISGMPLSEQECKLILRMMAVSGIGPTESLHSLQQQLSTLDFTQSHLWFDASAPQPDEYKGRLKLFVLRLASSAVGCRLLGQLGLISDPVYATTLQGLSGALEELGLLYRDDAFDAWAKLQASDPQTLTQKQTACIEAMSDIRSQQHGLNKWLIEQGLLDPALRNQAENRLRKVSVWSRRAARTWLYRQMCKTPLTGFSRFPASARLKSTQHPDGQPVLPASNTPYGRVLDKIHTQIDNLKLVDRFALSHGHQIGLSSSALGLATSAATGGVARLTINLGIAQHRMAHFSVQMNESWLEIELGSLSGTEKEAGAGVSLGIPEVGLGATVRAEPWAKRQERSERLTLRIPCPLSQLGSAHYEQTVSEAKAKAKILMSLLVHGVETAPPGAADTNPGKPLSTPLIDAISKHPQLSGVQVSLAREANRQVTASRGAVQLGLLPSLPVLGRMGIGLRLLFEQVWSDLQKHADRHAATKSLQRSARVQAGIQISLLAGSDQAVNSPRTASAGMGETVASDEEIEHLRQTRDGVSPFSYRELRFSSIDTLNEAVKAYYDGQQERLLRSEVPATIGRGHAQMATDMPHQPMTSALHYHNARAQFFKQAADNRPQPEWASNLDNLRSNRQAALSTIERWKASQAPGIAHRTASTGGSNHEYDSVYGIRFRLTTEACSKLDLLKMEERCLQGRLDNLMRDPQLLQNKHSAPVKQAIEMKGQLDRNRQSQKAVFNNFESYQTPLILEYQSAPARSDIGLHMVLSARQRSVAFRYKQFQKLETVKPPSTPA